ncbi:MarR family winged helix-turn-helix transcriptional regulator [Sphingomonas melonis]|jgi:MarR family transcriptional regulator for hemolysin|uniref:MarR family transcriptional regulator for hemolysin n=1 Tax=Sphingomonas melonis TaxID=152682 RepID=A0A7Y9K0K0_9SPHN|nr:MarR family transcriptional regulator [Sphingomonas melonis]NYD89943.1 MarR family transcriptional regulator for hemolysin [Sphingomonas melonis]
MRAFAAHLVPLGRRYRRALDNGLAGLSLSHTPALAVMLIGRAAEGLRQGALADQLGVEAPSVVPLVDQLERSGLVERRVDSTDKRARLLHLTEAGTSLAAQVEERTAEIRQTLLACIEADELIVATRVLDQLHATLTLLDEQG